MQRQAAWCRKVREERKFRIGHEDYDLRQEKKVRPIYRLTQTSDEFVQKRNRCVEFNVDYVNQRQHIIVFWAAWKVAGN